MESSFLGLLLLHLVSDSVRVSGIESSCEKVRCVEDGNPSVDSLLGQLIPANLVDSAGSFDLQIGRNGNCL